MYREGSGLFSMESAVLCFVSIDHNVFTCFGCECGTALYVLVPTFLPKYRNAPIEICFLLFRESLYEI